MGITTYRLDGSTIFDSDSSREGVCIGNLTYASGASGTLTYPALAGCTMVATAIGGGPTTQVAIVDHALGYPRVTVASAAYSRTFLLWVFGAPTSIPTTGMYANNSSGGIVLTPDGFGLNYIGQPTLVQTIANSGSTAGVSNNGRFRYQISSPTMPVPVVQLSSSNYVRNNQTPFLVSGTTWEFSIESIHPSTNDSTGLRQLVTPTVHCFARPTTEKTAPTFALYDSAGALAWDLMAGTLLQVYDRPSFGASTPAVNITIPSVLGILPMHTGQWETSTGGPIYHVNTKNRFWTLDTTNNQLRRDYMTTGTYTEDTPITNQYEWASEPILVNLTGVAL